MFSHLLEICPCLRNWWASGCPWLASDESWIKIQPKYRENRACFFLQLRVIPAATARRARKTGGRCFIILSMAAWDIFLDYCECFRISYDTGVPVTHAIFLVCWTAGSFICWSGNLFVKHMCFVWYNIYIPLLKYIFRHFVFSIRSKRNIAKGELVNSVLRVSDSVRDWHYYF